MKKTHGLDEREMELVKLLMTDCQTTGDIQAKLKKLFAGTIEQMLEAEMDEHLGYEKNSVAGNNSGNSRNGYGKKTIISDYGECEIAVPRDRNGDFEPKVIEKRQTRTDEIEQKIMQMYAKGMSQRDIEDTLKQIYGTEISQGLVSRITDKIMLEVNEWQNRPLEAVYPVVFFDGIVFNSRKDNKIVTKCVYSVLGINMEGHKEILGTWISENESASFYASICSDLQSRGIKDIFIACHDNLTGLCNAINSVFPKTKNQLCIVHQIRNSCKFVPYKDRKAVCADLKKIYGAVNLDDAEFAKECTYNAEKVDNAVMSIMRSIFANISGCPEEEKIQEAYRNAMSTNHAMQKKLEFELQKNKKQLEVLRGEISKSLTGESIYSSEDLSIALDKLKSRITEDEETLEKLKTEDDQKKLLADSVMPAYRQFRSWAEEFEDASLETKKMIACQLFSRVEVGKGYRIKVTMNMTYRQFVSEWGGESMMTV